ncbi:VTT domain-containing protein [Paractinoplanes toevensis]|nr:VTT domain-containing protein [Actinoplanes toevensis]
MPWLNDLLGGLPPLLVYAVVAGLVAAESAVVAGLVLPAATALIALGLLANAGTVQIVPALLVAIAAAALGGTVGFHTGRRRGPRVRTTRLGRWIGDKRWDRAERLFARQGGRAILLGQWIVGARTLIPRLAGMNGVPYGRFAAWHTPAAVLWSLWMVGASYLAGASYDLLAARAGRAGGALAALAVMIVALLLAGRWLGRHPRQFRRLTARPTTSHTPDPTDSPDPDHQGESTKVRAWALRLTEGRPGPARTGLGRPAWMRAGFAGLARVRPGLGRLDRVRAGVGQPDWVRAGAERPDRMRAGAERPDRMQAGAERLGWVRARVGWLGSGGGRVRGRRGSAGSLVDLGLGVGALFSLAALLVLVVPVVVRFSGLGDADIAVANWARSQWTSDGYLFALDAATFADPGVLFAVAAVVSVGRWWWMRHRRGADLGLLTAVGPVLPVVLLAAVYAATSPPAWEIRHTPTSVVFPAVSEFDGYIPFDVAGVMASRAAGHTAQLAAAVGLLAWMLAGRLPWKWRVTVWTAAAIYVATCGGAWVYLGWSRMSETVAAVVIGAAWAALNAAIWSAPRVDAAPKAPAPAPVIA